MSSISTNEVRILLVDDHPFILEGLINSLSSQNDFVVCGEASSASAALKAVQRLKPDVIVSDITMKGKSGLEFIRDLQVQYPEIPVVVLSMHEEKIYGERALEAGAKGYVMKSERPIKLIQAIRKVHAGGIQVSQKLSDLLLSKLSRKERKQQPQSRIRQLTNREFEVFQLIGQGENPKEIARDLCLSIKTVNAHRSNIREKLDLDSLNDLLIYAIRWVESEG
jgi:DNA-binding NarL/FixJ family response regulator